MYKPAAMEMWKGRDDGNGAERWHQLIVPLTETECPSGITLLGVATDEGVRRNRGRIGAAAGPAAIRKALAGLACHQKIPLYDAGDICCEDGDLEMLQREQADKVCHLLEQRHFPLIIGGGHEIAYGNFSGLAKYISNNQNPDPIGVINFDAHFDLRSAEHSTSGTPFLQVAKDCQKRGWPFHYFCLGINETANTRSLFTTAAELGIDYFTDEEIVSWNLQRIKQRLEEFIRNCGAIYLSIDLDVLPAATAPGVSAPAARGVALPELEWLVSTIKSLAAERLKLADIAEYNPRYDIDGRTARTAARLCHLLIRKEES